MLVVTALVVAILFLSFPWNFLLVIGAGIVDLGETVLLIWWSRRRRGRGGPEVGPEMLVGKVAIAASALAPEGQVRVHGEIWQARSEEPVAAGQEVVVRAVDGLRLEVAPADASGDG